MGLAEPNVARHTYADYVTWPDEARYELIDGSAYLMAPAPALAHIAIHWDALAARLPPPEP